MTESPWFHIGQIPVTTPVELAPMAGITNQAYRRLCREQGGGIYVSEMITTRALVERTPETMRLIQFTPDESPRSMQLYGVDPRVVYQAASMVRDENLADHIDLNFGCPVPKVTRKGGGAALPWKRDLFAAVVSAAVRGAGDLPVTVKMRVGVDQDHLTFLDAGKAAEDAGVSAMALHGRTLSEFYSGQANWSRIAQLKQAVTSIPVLGNGDIWSAADAVRMMDETGCDGVVVGRGCLGRPWLFADLEDAFMQYRKAGFDISKVSFHSVHPTLGQVAAVFYRHAELLVDFFDSELRACRDIRKHVAWYFKGYPVGKLRAQLALVESLSQLRRLLDTLDPSIEYPGAEAEGPRGRTSRPKRPALPQGWLDSACLESAERAELHLAELGVSGG